MKSPFFSFNPIFQIILLPLLTPLYIIIFLIDILKDMSVLLLDRFIFAFLFVIETIIETIVFYLNPINWVKAIRNLFLFPARLIKSFGAEHIYLKKTECLICNFQFQEEILQKDIISFQQEMVTLEWEQNKKDIKAKQKEIETKMKKDFDWLNNKLNKKNNGGGGGN